MTGEDYTKPPAFGLNNLAGLVLNDYYWCRNMEEGTRFIALLGRDANWYIIGNAYPVPVTREQIICKVKAPEN